nr:MAG TPA: hypothetical protein [Caudoviricetes sp.]
MNLITKCTYKDYGYKSLTSRLTITAFASDKR